MAESQPVVTLPGDDDGGGAGAGAPGGSDFAAQDIVVLQGFVVEELPVAEGGGVEEGSGLGFEVAEPEEDVILVEEVVERVAGGPPRGGMATDAGIHPVTVQTTDLPIEDVPPDETMTADMVADKSIGEGGNGEVVSEAPVVTEVTEEKVTVVQEVVTTVEEVVEATGEVVAKTVTDSVKIDEVVTVTETVTEGDAMETEGEKADKKRLRDSEELAAVKKLKADAEEKEEEEEKVVEPKKLGPKVFNSGVEMFTYCYNLLHDWNLNQNVNKYEFLVLNELVNQGNPSKVGNGIASFQVRMHEKWQSRCFYLIRKDGTEDDFSYRKCVDALMPLPKSLYRKNGELDLEKLFPGQKGRHHREQNGGGRGGGRGDRGGRGGRGGGGRGFHGGRGGGGHRGGRGGGGGGRRGGRGRW
ncbi:hypothetical protein KC19_12G140800 [Ceratodon purpureus]|uniref:Uncharacterized protein n=1 Tax=Ceratodon purpureus TaxID=3225 RepID=A0A8T0G6Z0_CERPU|nr:hypothetical protein KC19_12G140800 [Ceratodon purpureus]